MSLFEQACDRDERFSRLYPLSRFLPDDYVRLFKIDGLKESLSKISSYHAKMVVTGTGDGPMPVYPTAVWNYYLQLIESVNIHDGPVDDEFLCNTRDFISRKVGPQGLPAEVPLLTESMKAYIDEGDTSYDLALDCPEEYEILFQRELMSDLGKTINDVLEENKGSLILKPRQVYRMLLSKEESSTGAFYRTTKESRNPSLIVEALKASNGIPPIELSKFAMVAQYRHQRSKYRCTFGDSLPHLVAYYGNCHLLTNELLHRLPFVGFFGEDDVAMRIAAFMARHSIRPERSDPHVVGIWLDQKACDQHCSVLHALQVWDYIMTQSPVIDPIERERIMDTIASYFYGALFAWDGYVYSGRWKLRSGIGPTSATEIMILVLAMCRALARWFKDHSRDLRFSIPDCEYFGIGDDASILIRFPDEEGDSSLTREEIASRSMTYANEIMNRYGEVCAEWGMECELSKCHCSTEYIEFCQRYYPLSLATSSVRIPISSLGSQLPSTYKNHPEWFGGKRVLSYGVILRGKYSLAKALNNVMWPEDGALRIQGVPRRVSDFFRLCYVLDNATADPLYPTYVMKLANDPEILVRILFAQFAAVGVRIRGWRSKVFNVDGVWSPQASITFAQLIRLGGVAWKDEISFMQFCSRLCRTPRQIRSQNSEIPFKDQWEYILRMTKDNSILGDVARAIVAYSESNDPTELKNLWRQRSAYSISDVAIANGGSEVSEEYIH